MVNIYDVLIIVIYSFIGGYLSYLNHSYKTKEFYIIMISFFILHIAVGLSILK